METIFLKGSAEISPLHDDNKTRILLGGQSITLDKIYGPTIFADLRITPDAQRGWVIERLCYDEFREWVVIPAQLDSDFPEEN